MKYYVCDIYVYCCHVFLYTQLDETVSLAGLEKAINYFEVFMYACVSVCLSVYALVCVVVTFIEL